MTKKEWHDVMLDNGLKHWKGSEGRGWLSILPGSIGRITPVPYVCVESAKVPEIQARLWQQRLTLQWSTMFLIEGHSHPKGTSVFALTRPGEEWWRTHELVDGQYRSTVA